jgi:lipid-A-disaccharide synthase
LNRPVLIIAGESSGDNVGGLLCAELKKLRPDLPIFGIGGDRMEKSGTKLLYHTSQLSFLGFWEVLKHLPFIKKVERDILERVEREKPALAILIDYPGFNLRLAAKLRERNLPVVYYVSPQVWAWGKGRIAKIKSLVNKMVVVFEFEQEMYKKEGLAAEWFGHPLLEIVQAQYSREEFFRKIGLTLGDRYIGLFPGSRKQELEMILPVMRNAARGLSDPAITAVVACAPGIDDAYYRRLGGDDLRYVRGLTYDLMAQSELNLVASGTATLECAILGKPQFVLYKTSPITYHIAKNLIKIPYIGLVNVVAGEKIAPEFIQGDCNPDKIRREIEHYLEDQSYREKMLSGLSSVKAKLGNPGASRKVAALILGIIDKQG